MNIEDRALVLVDLETTHLDPQRGEILEIGAVRVDQRTLAIEATFSAKVKPEHIETAQPKALEVNGYTEEAWQNALSHWHVLPSFFDFARQSLFASYAVQFDWGFLRPHIHDRYGASSDHDIRRFGPFERHLVDIPSIAWSVLGSENGLSKNKIAKALGLGPEPDPHRALTGALHGLEVLRRLRRFARMPFDRWEADEQAA